MIATDQVGLPSRSTVAALASRRLAEATRDRVRWTQQRFSEWARAHEQPAMPATEQSLILWLHGQGDRLSPMTMRAYADAVRTAHRLAGHPDPGGPRLAAYLVAMRREAAVAGQLRRPRVIAVDLRDVVNAVDGELRRADPCGPLLEMRAGVGLLLGRACQAPLRQLVRVQLSGVELDGDDLVVQLPATALDSARIVHMTRDPGDALCPVQAVSRYLPLLPADTTRLLGVVVKPPAPRLAPVVRAETTLAHRSHRVHGQCLLTAGRRAGLVVPLDPYPSAGMTDADVAWLLRFLNWQVLRQMRDRAYVLLGTAHAHRADELNRLTVGDILERSGGLDVLLRCSKTDSDGEGDLLPVDHEEEDPSAGCVRHCPVGAAQAWIATMRRLWDVGADDTLFPSMRAGKPEPTGRLITADASRMLRQLLGRDDVSSRTLRASTITGLRAENESLHSIAEVSRHRSVEQLARYLRILDPHTDQYHLPV